MTIEVRLTHSTEWEEFANKGTGMVRNPQTWAEIEITGDNFFEVAEYFGGEVVSGWRQHHYEDFITVEYVSHNSPVPFIVSEKIEKPVTVGDRISIDAGLPDEDIWWVELEPTTTVETTTLDEFMKSRVQA